MTAFNCAVPKKSVFFLILVAAVNALAGDTALLSVADTLVIDSKRLVLNGSGIRTKLFIPLTLNALYLEKKETSADAIMNDTNSFMAIKFQIISTLVSREALASTIEIGLSAYTRKTRLSIEKEKQIFLSFLYREKINPGDVFIIGYSPAQGIVLSKNNTALGTIPGYQFKRAIFSLWIGKNVEQPELKMKLLGLP